MNTFTLKKLGISQLSAKTFRGQSLKLSSSLILSYIRNAYTILVKMIVEILTDSLKTVKLQQLNQYSD